MAQSYSFSVAQVPEATSFATPKAVQYINKEISATMKGTDATCQADLDRKMIELDGTPNKGRLGVMQFSLSRWRRLGRLRIQSTRLCIDTLADCRPRYCPSR